MALPNAVLYVEQMDTASFFDTVNADPAIRILNVDELEAEFECWPNVLVIGQCRLLGELQYLAKRITAERVSRVPEDTQPVNVEAKRK